MGSDEAAEVLSDVHFGISRNRSALLCHLLQPLHAFLHPLPRRFLVHRRKILDSVKSQSDVRTILSKLHRRSPFSFHAHTSLVSFRVPLSVSLERHRCALIILNCSLAPEGREGVDARVELLTSYIKDLKRSGEQCARDSGTDLDTGNWTNLLNRTALQPSLCASLPV
jgi:hypothetical protein